MSIRGRFAWFGAVLALATMLVTEPVAAVSAPPKNRGLFITPLRTYLQASPGKTQTNKFTIANITDKPMEVALSVEQFSVADYTYDYRFTTPKEDWVRVNVVHTKLEPNKSQVITYTVAPPKNATPGGHYFTVLASTTQHAGGISTQVQAATMLYVTVDGELRRTSVIQDGYAPRLAFGGDIPFRIDSKNTGNAHFFIYLSGQVEGLSSKGRGVEATHLLLPGAVRRMEGSMPAPLLPGVYRAVYGYRTETGQTVQRSQLIAYLPPWALAIPIAAVWIVLWWLRRRKRLRFTRS